MRKLFNLQLVVAHVTLRLSHPALAHNKRTAWVLCFFLFFHSPLHTINVEKCTRSAFFLYALPACALCADLHLPAARGGQYWFCCSRCLIKMNCAQESSLKKYIVHIAWTRCYTLVCLSSIRSRVQISRLQQILLCNVCNPGLIWIPLFAFHRERPQFFSCELNGVRLWQILTEVDTLRN